MSKQGDLSREQAVAMVGEVAVDALESMNCEPTGRVGYNGADCGDHLTEWSASLRCKDSDGDNVTLVAYYYTTDRQDRILAETGDGACIDWKIEGFEVVE